MMKVQAILGLAAGTVLCLSSLAHAFLGWPPLRAALAKASVDPGLVEALEAGWYFGSISMAVFGIMHFLAVRHAMKGQQVFSGAAGTIAVGYLVFGSAAYFLRHQNPHFLLFVGTGLLAGLFACFRVRP